MSISAWLYLTPYALSALICAGIGLYVLRHKRGPGARCFGYLALLEAIWITGYMMQEVSMTLPAKLFWNDFQFLGAVTLPVAYFWFGFTFAGHTFTHSGRIRFITFSGAAVLLLLIWTDSLHHLFRISPHLVSGNPFSALVFIDGPLFNLYPLIAYSLLLAGTYALIHNSVTAPRAYRLQINTVLFGILIPWITTVVTWLKLIPIQLHDITPLTFAISNLIVAFALFRYGLFDIVPFAYYTLVEQMADGILVLDSEHRIMDINPTAQRILSLSLTSAIGKRLENYLPGGADLLDAGASPSVRSELMLMVADTQRVFEVIVTLLLDNRHAPSGYLMLLRDITEQQAAEQKLHELAITDPLTGIFNRRHFFNLAEAEFERVHSDRQSMAIIIFDLDRFKHINDTFGHMVGDQVLQGVVSSCQKYLRPSDIIARYGGEEFIVLLPHTYSAEALQVGDRLRSVISDQLISTTNGSVSVTASFGIASLSWDEHQSIDQLVEEADRALYAAKKNGRNQSYLSDGHLSEN